MLLVSLYTAGELLSIGVLLLVDIMDWATLILIANHKANGAVTNIGFPS